MRTLKSGNTEPGSMIYRPPPEWGYFMGKLDDGRTLDFMKSFQRVSQPWDTK
jgi:hypothetical protein